MTPPAHNLAEIELADRARCGDQDALVALYGRYKEVLYRHAWRMLRSDASAKDMVQEAFTRAIVSLPQTRAAPELRFRAWMLRIITNLCLRELNRGQRGAADDRDPDLLASERRELDPQQARQRTELGVLVERALDALPDRYRQILLLREVDELSYEELSETLEMSDSSVKVTLHRARARFAAVFLAERILEEPDARRDCPELQSLLREPGPERRLVRHLESCTRCREEEQRSASQLLALLPPLPAAAVSALPAEPTTPATTAATAGATSSTAGVGAAAASAAAVSGGGGLSVGLIAAIAAATVGIVGVAIAAAVALHPGARQDGRLASPATASAPAERAGASERSGAPERAGEAERGSTAVLRSEAAGEQRAAASQRGRQLRGKRSGTSSGAATAPGGQPGRGRTGPSGWTSRKSPPRSVGPVRQEADREEAPALPSSRTQTPAN